VKEDEIYNEYEYDANLEENEKNAIILHV